MAVLEFRQSESLRFKSPLVKIAKPLFPGKSKQPKSPEMSHTIIGTGGATRCCE